RRRAEGSLPPGSGHHRRATAAHSGVSDAVQPRLQRHRLLFAGDGLRRRRRRVDARSEEHTSELQSREKLVCRLLLEKKNLYFVSFTVNAIFIFCKTTNLLRNLFKMSDVINLVLQ